MSDVSALDQVFGEGEVVSKPVPEAQPAPQPDATAAERPRDENGRFAPKVEQPAPAAPEPIAAPEPTQQKPLIEPEQFKGYLEEREKRQKLEAEVKALRERVEQQSAQPIPSFAEDPEGYAEHLRKEVQRTAISNRFDASEFAARQVHGDDNVQKAMDWGMERSNSSQAFATEYVQQRHPIDWIVKQYKRDQLLTQIGDKDPVEWAKELLAQQQPAAPPNPQAPASASPQPAASSIPPPTPSLATARSAGVIGKVVPDGTPFDSAFPR